jgi:hypothetical protein
LDRLGRRVAPVRTKDITMPEVVGIMTGAIETPASRVEEQIADAEAGIGDAGIEEAGIQVQPA